MVILSFFCVHTIMQRENPDVWKKFGEHWTPEMYETLKSCDLWYSLGINSKTFLSQMWATSEEFSSFQTWQTWQHLKNSQQNEGLLWILKCSLTFHISWKKTNIQPGEPLGHQWCEKNSTTLRLRVNHLFEKKNTHKPGRTQLPMSPRFWTNGARFPRWPAPAMWA